MLAASFVLPHPLLNTFVKHYIVCESAHAVMSIDYPLYAHHETSIGFFLGNTSVQNISDSSGSRQSPERVFLFGLSSKCSGAMRSEGDYKTFTIVFTPGGFSRIFGIPSAQISNKIFAAEDVIGSGISRLFDELLHASDAMEMTTLTNSFLLEIFQQREKSYCNNGIAKISDYILSGDRAFTIAEYAHEANMSLRNFERSFKDQIGISPKLFCRLLRFNSAFNYKICKPSTAWSEVANEFGYSDTMHLIKEFKQFTNTSPAALIKDKPELTKNNCYKVQLAMRD